MAEFCIACCVSPTKDGQNSAYPFRAAEEMTDHNPLITTSDSPEAIASGHSEAFGDDPRSIHIRGAHTHSRRKNNNPRGRFNATLRRLIHGRRGRLSDTVITAALLYCNHLRPHTALGGIAPTEKAGMHASGPDTMMTPIQNAAMSDFTVPQPRWAER